MLRSAVIFTVIVACSNVWQSVARPTEGDGINKLDNSWTGQSGDQYFYKLPSAVTAGFVMTIEGIISTNDIMFTTVLPSSTGGDVCKIVYDFATSTLDVMPPSDPNHEPISYTLNLNPGTTETKFYLVLTARTVNGNNMFDITFEGNRDNMNGLSDTIACKVKDFDQIGSIIMKGVKSVNSLLFVFPK